MGSAIVLGAMLCVFFTRDLQLLAIAPPDHFRVRLIIYSTCTLAYLISFTVFLTSAGAATTHYVCSVPPPSGSRVFSGMAASGFSVWQ